MNLSEYSTLQLVEIINQASGELAQRLSEPNIERVKAEQPTITMRTPNDDDRDFVLRLKTAVLRGGYATAAERNRIAELAEQGFDTWIARQGLPTDRGTWAWRKLAERSRKAPAKER